MKYTVRNHRLYKDGRPVARKRTGRKSRGRLPSNPDIVIHYTVGEDFRSMVRALTQDGAGHGSAHIVLGKQGEIAQVEDFTSRLWHAGQSHWKGRNSLNATSIGIEVCCKGWLNERNEEGNWRQRWKAYNKEKKKWEWRYSRWFDAETDELAFGKHPNRAVYIPTFGPGTRPNVCAWPRFTAEQMEALDGIIGALMQAYDIREVVGHDDISPGRKQDPGLCVARSWLADWNRRGASDPNPKPVPVTSKPARPSGKIYRRPVRRGARNNTVKLVQEQLAAFGFKSVGPADGDFGPRTERALKAFQRKHKLTVDGVAGPQTYAALFA